MYISLLLYIVEMRKLRKMGHVTIVGPSMSKVKRCLDMLLSPETTEHVVGNLSPSQSYYTNNFFSALNFISEFILKYYSVIRHILVLLYAYICS